MKKRILLYAVSIFALVLLATAAVSLGAPAALTSYGHALFDPATPTIQEYPAVTTAAKVLNDKGLPVLWITTNPGVVSIGLNVKLGSLTEEQIDVLSSTVPYLGNHLRAASVIIWFWSGHGNNFDTVYCDLGTCSLEADVHTMNDGAWQRLMVDTHLVRPWPLN